MDSKCKRCGKDHQNDESNFCSVECTLDYILEKDIE